MTEPHHDALVKSPVVHTSTNDNSARSNQQNSEQRRVEILRSYDLIDSPNKPNFDNLARLAARLFDVPIVLISLIEDEYVRFKAHYGIELEQIRREESIFGDAVAKNRDVLVVPDATLDERLINSPFITGDYNFRFFAGAPLFVAENVHIGTFCVIDTKPRDFTDEDCLALSDFATLCVNKFTRHRNETIYRSLIENGSELIMIFMDDGTVTYVSPSIERHLGYNADEFIGVTVYHLIHPEDHRYVLEEFQKLVDGPTLSKKLNFRFLHKNGYYLNLKSIGTNRLDDKFIKGIVVNAHDVTESVKIDAELRESESRFKTAFEQSSLGMALVSTEGKWLRINGAIAEMLGYTEEELQQLDFQAITHPDDLHTDLELLERTLKGEISFYSMEKRYCHKDGHHLWCELNVSLVRDSQDRPSYFISQIQNITERKEQEQRLRLLESVAVNATDSILITEIQPPNSSIQKIVYANHAFTAMTGYEEEELIGKTTTLFHGPQTSEATKSFIQSKVKEWSPFTTEIINYRKDGSAYWVDVSFTPIADKNGVYTHWGALARNITARKDGENLLEQARQQAEKANAAKSEFLSRMSHEFRTPLNAILGFAQLLEIAPLAEKDQQSVGYIMDAGHHLLELVNEVLDISRIESGHLKLQIEPLKISDIAMEIFEWGRPLAAQRDIRIEFTDGQNSIMNSKLSIAADAQRLRQILLNLLSNALKFNRAGGSITLASSEVVYGERTFGIISVTDTGLGITEEQSERIFQPFERLSAERNGIEGSGIGLALSKQLAQAMGGDLRFKSTPDVGSTFWIELPVSNMDSNVPSITFESTFGN